MPMTTVYSWVMGHDEYDDYEYDYDHDHLVMALVFSCIQYLSRHLSVEKPLLTIDRVSRFALLYTGREVRRSSGPPCCMIYRYRRCRFGIVSSTLLHVALGSSSLAPVVPNILK
jgi:hypothetical protein